MVKRWLSGGQEAVKWWLFGGQNVKKRANAVRTWNPRHWRVDWPFLMASQQIPLCSLLL
ncbi:hypothetical protein A1D15_1746 [Lactiplantibacillus plantarum]|uniref:Uncharacterized protein n=1 Tax=Lactiplantibacillus plantarum TaxID=1590 RepID=A0A162G660_LACPN|nr:hypothetical protein A1D15_1746 [Lactiplantibacillus plantarum]KZU96005.1 hypothetical protein Lp19_1160 [Lactiplantibacillus plantarum]